MDIGTERYFEAQKTKRAVVLGIKEGLVFPCERCASTLVGNVMKIDEYFEGRDSEREEWQRTVRRSRAIADEYYCYMAWGLGRAVFVCETCSDEIENWQDKKIQEEFERWPIEVER